MKNNKSSNAIYGIILGLILLPLIILGFYQILKESSWGERIWLIFCVSYALWATRNLYIYS